MKVFWLLLVLLATLLPGQAADVDNRTTPVWTNYFNSKFSVNGPTSPGWKKNRGNQAVMEDELRRMYFQALANGDESLQDQYLEQLLLVNPQNPDYPAWKKLLEQARNPPEEKEAVLGAGGAKTGHLTNGVGRLAIPGPEDSYLWELAVPGGVQSEILEKVESWRKQRKSAWSGVRVRVLPSVRQPEGGRLISLEPLTLPQANELTAFVRQIYAKQGGGKWPEPAPDLELLAHQNPGNQDRKSSLSRIVRLGGGQGQAGTPEEPTYSFTARGMPLEQALALFGRLNGLNILPDPDATGLLSVDFRGLTLDKAMDAMLGSFGYFAEEDGGLIRVRAMETRRFVVDYPRASRMGKTTTTGEISMPTTEGTTGGGASASSGDSSNVTIETEAKVDMWQTVISNVQRLLSDVDASSASSVEAAGGMTLTQSNDAPAAPSAGASGTVSRSQSSSTRISGFDPEKYLLLSEKFKKGPRLFADSVSGVIVVRDKRDNLDAIEQYLKDLNRSIQRQVDLNVRIFSVEFDDGRELAIDWNQVAVVAGNTLITGSALLAPGTLPTSLQGLSPLSLTVTNSKVTSVIKAIEQQGKLKLITQPRLRTLNHQPAVVKIQTTTPFFIQSADSQQNVSGNVLATSVEVNNVTTGTLLSMTPQISDDGTIALDVIPVLSNIKRIESIVGQGPSGGATTQTNATAPVVDIRQAATLIRVRDGETAILGGLVEEESTQVRKKIPGLGDIPGLGVLFTGMADAKVLRELVFFISPTIVQDLPVAQK